MKRTGIVLETKGGRAKVKVVRETACGENCGECRLCEDKSAESWMINAAGAEPGDIVLVEMKTSRLLLMAFVAYIVPIIAGVLVFAVLRATVGKGDLTDLVSFAAVILTIFFAAILGPFGKEKYQSRVVEIIKKEAGNEQD